MNGWQNANNLMDRQHARAIGLHVKRQPDGLWWIGAGKELYFGPFRMHGNALDELARVGHYLRTSGIVTQHP